MNKEKLVATTTKTGRKKYSPEFKDQAIALIKQQGVPKTALDLDLPESMLYSWRSQQQKSGSAFETQKLKDAELSRLRRELARAQEENAFLKKAAATFAKESKQRSQQ